MSFKEKTKQHIDKHVKKYAGLFLILNMAQGSGLYYKDGELKGEIQLNGVHVQIIHDFAKSVEKECNITGDKP